MSSAAEWALVGIAATALVMLVPLWVYVVLDGLAHLRLAHRLGRRWLDKQKEEKP